MKNFRRECLLDKGGFGRIYKGKMSSEILALLMVRGIFLTQMGALSSRGLKKCSSQQTIFMIL